MIKALLIVCFLAAGCCGIQAQGKTSDELIKILTAPGTSRDARKKAAKKLALKPPAEVLPKLLEVRRKYGPAISGWGQDHFANGSKVSWEQAAAITASYAWSGNLKNRSYTQQEKGAALLDLLRREKSVSRKAGILYDLKFNWVDDAELDAVSILGDSRADWNTHYAAADVLLATTGIKHYGEIYSTALDAPLEGQESFARLLLTMQSPEWKARVLRYAFSVIQLERTAYPDRLAHGYFIACALEGYVGAQFTPKQSPDSKTTDSFFIETVENALRWWRTIRVLTNGDPGF